MSIKVFKANKAGKIEFTRCELEKLLNETYHEGYIDGEKHAKSNYWTWTSPSIINSPYRGNDIIYDTDRLLCTNTTDSLISTATLRDNASIAGAFDDTTATSAKAAIDPSNLIKVEVCPIADNAPKTTKEVLKETPAKTCESKGMVFDMGELAKTVDAILSGKCNLTSMLTNPINANGAKKAIEDTPFTNLAKELRGL